MSLTKFNPRTLIILLMIMLVAAIRVVFISNQELSPLSNFSPLGAMALFGGAYFSNKGKAFSFPLLTLFLSDLFLSFTVFSEFRTGLLYGGWYWTYGAFALMTVAGRLIIKKVSPGAVLVAALTAVFIHWIITDFGVWLNGTLYPKTAYGYIECLIAALPFEWNLFAGTIIYGTALFGGFEWMQKRYTVLRAAAA